MKTKTLDVYLFSEEPFSGLQTLSHIAKELNKEAGYTIKAKLTIDLSEKKKEFTYSEVKQIISEHYDDGHGMLYFRNKILVKMFGVQYE